jgi:hypothetical protein
MRTPRGNSVLTVKVAGVDGIRKALRPWLDPELTNELDAANKKAAQTMARQLRSALAPVSKHMARAVRVKRAKTGKPGWVVGSRRKGAFFWHMVIGGTADHGPRRAKSLVFVPGWNPYLGGHSPSQGWVRVARVKGVRARPIVEQVAQQYEGRVADQIDGDIARATGT